VVCDVQVTVGVEANVYPAFEEMILYVPFCLTVRYATPSKPVVSTTGLPAVPVWGVAVTVMPDRSGAPE